MMKIREHEEKGMNPMVSMVELEATLTQSAFGHEYALMNLTEVIPYSRRQEIMAQLEEHKKAYFWARERLLQIDPEKLFALEQDLQYQKEAILRVHPTIH